ncbi:Uncharacterized protein APZ42_027151 [Daphnia magna]|uniref:Uncharacterized protein n=1 Tax=Daphnia magna TaxID=35525 RepID=A0A164RBK1_9CRUS|nr:Uncharacterized protein APZ42_027151 [Daphnia magna]
MMFPPNPHRSSMSSGRYGIHSEIQTELEEQNRNARMGFFHHLRSIRYTQVCGPSVLMAT